MKIAKVEAKVTRTPFSGSFRTTYGEMPTYAHELVGPYYLTQDPFGELSVKGDLKYASGCGFGIEDRFESLAEG